jgi:hypothetical protein
MAPRSSTATVRTPAQWYCTIIGATLVVVGILGFIADSSFGTGSSVQGSNLVIFEVNGWHNIVHLASGIFLLAMSPRRRTAKTAAMAFGAVYGLVAIWGLIDGNDVIGLVPVNGADNVLHILLAALGLVTGAISDADDWDARDRVGDGRGTDQRVGRSSAEPAGTGTPRFERSAGEAPAERGAGEAGAERAAGETAPPRRGRQRDEGLRNRR